MFKRQLINVTAAATFVFCSSMEALTTVGIYKKRLWRLQKRITKIVERD